MPGDPTHPAQHVLGFERLTGMTPEQLEELAGALAGGPALLTPSQLVSVVRPFVGDDAPAVADALLGVAYIARETAQSDPVALVGQYLRDSGWDDTQLIAFARISRAVATIAQLRAVQALSKSIDLGFAHSLPFASAQVITDSRPVYSPEAQPSVVRSPFAEATLRAATAGVEAAVGRLREADIPVYGLNDAGEVIIEPGSK
jgi:hypothetical protein